ncbi:hypothetical protein MKX01_019232, partial [Papaver californicum]
DAGKYSANNAKRQMDMRVSHVDVVWQPWLNNSHYNNDEVIIARTLSKKIVRFSGVEIKRDAALYLGERCLRQLS